MFGFIARRRLCRKAASQSYNRRSSVRRLRVEAMEGRLMLSTNVADFASDSAMDGQWIRSTNAANFVSVDSHVMELSLSSTALRAYSIGSFDDGALTEGGFLRYVLRANTPADGAPLALQDSVSVAELFVGRFNTTRANFDSHIPADFDTDSIPTVGISPLVISPTASEATLYTPTISPLTTTFYEGLGDDEGGEIPIQPILASVGPGATLRSGDGVLAKTQNDSHSSPPGMPIVAAPMDDGRISGEWARPTMLELAGGEPQRQERPAAVNRTDRVDHTRESALFLSPPLSSNRDSHASEMRLAQYHATDKRDYALADIGAAAGDRLDVFAAKVFRESDSRKLQPQYTKSSQAAIAHYSRALEAYSAGNGLTAFEDDEAAYASVFEQLSAGDLATTRLLEDEDSWGGPLKVTSFLTILALERITNGNSRRSNARRQRHLSAGLPACVTDPHLPLR